MQWEFIATLAIAIAVILFLVVFIWYLNIAGIYGALREAYRGRVAQRHMEGQTRALAIVNNRIRTTVLVIGKLTISSPMRIVLPAAIAMGIYASLIWFCLAGFGWEVALALGLAMPTIAALMAFAWYLNASGLYQVIRAIRQKRASERRLARMLKQAMVQMLEETLAEETTATIETAPREQLRV